MESIWSRNTEIPKRQSLPGNIQVQAAVIGAGMAGILTAHFLKKAGIEVVVVEAKRIASGQTQNTTAKITSQHGMIYDRMIRNIGKKRARNYAMANENAIQLYEKMVEEEKISCEFQKLPAYLFSTEETKICELKKEAEAAKTLGINAFFVGKDEMTELPFETAGAVCFEGQAQFHPLKFIRHLAENLTVYENTKVLSVKKHLIHTDKGDITADHIVFASHYPFTNLPGFYFLRQHQERSYVLMLDGDKKLDGMYYSIDGNGLSLRGVNGALLLGGGAHRTGMTFPGNDCEKKKNMQQSSEGLNCCGKYGYSYLRSMAQKYYPDRKETAHWAAQDCMPHDDIPFAGKYSLLRPYWYVATGFHKWGMTSSMIAAVIISTQICAKIPDFQLDKKLMDEKTFQPQRFLFRASIKNLLTDTGISIKGLGKGFFGKKANRCPHMGCRLEWNPQEQSYDCPCHGSRFSREGKLIDNPAQTSKM